MRMASVWPGPSGLLGSGVEDGGRAAGQCALDGGAIKDLHVVAFQVFSQRHLDLFLGIGHQRPGPPRPADGQIARGARCSPWLFDMDGREGDKTPSGRGEAQRSISCVTVPIRARLPNVVRRLNPFVDALRKIAISRGQGRSAFSGGMSWGNFPRRCASCQP